VTEEGRQKCCLQLLALFSAFGDAWKPVERLGSVLSELQLIVGLRDVQRPFHGRDAPGNALNGYYFAARTIL
jgi:hypothetical protein